MHRILLTLLPLLHLCVTNYYIDEGCCEMFLEEANCIKQCLEVIRNENITQFSRDLFTCAPTPTIQRRIVTCVTRSNYGLPLEREVCCDKANTTACRNECVVSSPVNDFNRKCSRNDESLLYSCIDEYLHLKECCWGSRVNMSCATACNTALDSAVQDGLAISDWVNVRLHCDDPFPGVKECTTRYSGHSNTSRFECCNLSDNEQCRYICDKGRSGDYAQTEVLEAMNQSCGDDVLTDKTWLCIMEGSDENRLAPPGDITAIQCCRKAHSLQCQNLCRSLYNDWLNSELWDKFAKTCRYQPREEEMANCILDISEPCTLGCRHLTFCENLNNRPLDLFRTCTSRHDEGAETDYNMWAERGFIETPLVNITVLNITTCKPDMWKGIACVLQTQPCHAKSHSNSICNSVCIELLSTCLDKRRSHRSVDEICAILAPNTDPDACIDLDHYMTPGLSKEEGEVTHPCQPSPCTSSQQCVLNRSCANGDMTCLPYLCLDSCSIGAARDYQVEVGSWVRIPVIQDSDCYKVCTCDNNRKLSSCQQLQCPGNKPCKIGLEYYRHLNPFSYECNTCVCYSGMTTCTKRSCDVISGRGDVINTLPGNCQPYYSPVCGINGATYFNPCVARQFNMDEAQLHFQDCNSVDVCLSASCDDNQVCRPKRQICLDLKFPCPQYVCEYPTINCEGEDLEPVCDTSNVQHPHMCSLRQQNRQLAHPGYCVGSCNATTGTVCGANGRNYASACTAKSDFMIVDYLGKCQPPTDADLSQGRYCSTIVECPVLPKICLPNRIPGMCCPVCGASVSLVPSDVLVAINENYLQNEKLTVALLCRKLNGLLSLSQCLVQCSLGLYGDVVALVYTTELNPTWVQIEACNNEAIRLETMISIRHPRIQTDLVLSTVLSAKTITVNITGNKNNNSFIIYNKTKNLFIVFICLVLYHTLFIR